MHDDLDGTSFGTRARAHELEVDSNPGPSESIRCPDRHDTATGAVLGELGGLGELGAGRVLQGVSITIK